MSERVLLVEDNASVMAQLNQALTKAGYQVTTAINGLDGFNKAQRQSFDLCIVDHLMPLMSGPQFLKNMPGLGDKAPTNIIFLTTQDIKMVTQIFDVQAADIILSKPICDESLLEQVQRLLQKNSEVA